MRSFLKSEHGNIAILFALLSALVIAGAGIGFDYMRWGVQRAAMQEAADAGAVAGAVELGLGGHDVVARAKSKAVRVAKLNQTSGLENAAPQVVVDQTARTGALSLSMPAVKTLSALLIKQDSMIAASSTAIVVDKVIACIFALNVSATAAINGNGSAVLQGTNCAIQVNSNAASAITNSGTISASHICVNGGYSGSGYSPTPQTGCAPLDDPFASTIIPPPGTCTFNKAGFNADATLSPGTYCGGLKVAGNATLSLLPGDYHIVDGELSVTSGASLVGSDVVFIFSGASTMHIAGSGKVRTTPPSNGPLAGYSMVQNRNAPLGGAFKVTGEGQFKFPGILYLPRAALEVSGRADGNVYIPAYAAIVADTIKISGQGELAATADTSNFSNKAASTLTVVNTRIIR